MGLRFENLRRPRQLADVDPHHLEQLVALGVQYDGERTSPEERIASLRDAELWSVGDRYEVWTHDVDCGSIFYAGSPLLVGAIVQFGFACHDFAAWLDAPFDPKGELRNVVLGSSRERIEGLRSLYGSPPIFRRDAIVRAIAVLEAMPRDVFLEKLRAFLERTETLAVA